MPRPKSKQNSPHRLCARLRSRNTRGLQDDAKFVAQTLRASAVETHMDMSQEPFYARICSTGNMPEAWQEGIVPDTSNRSYGTAADSSLRILPESPQELLLRVCTGSCKGLLRGIEQDLHKSPLTREFSRKMPCPTTMIRLDPRFARACSVKIDMDMSEETFYARILKENAAPQDHDKTVAHTLRAHRGPTLREPAQSKWT